MKQTNEAERRARITIAGLLRSLRSHWRAVALLLVGIGIPALALASLAEDVWTHEGFSWDRPIQNWAHGLSSPAMDSVMIGISRLGYTWGVVPACLLLFVALLAARRTRSAAFFATAMMGAVALEIAGKLLFRRVRPELWLVSHPEPTFSFPSGHATLTATFAAALTILAWHTRWRWPALLLGGSFALLVGFSRVYLGVHYPSDVVAGWALSVAWTIGVWRIRGPEDPRDRVGEAEPHPTDGSHTRPTRS